MTPNSPLTPSYLACLRNLNTARRIYCLFQPYDRPMTYFFQSIYSKELTVVTMYPLQLKSVFLGVYAQKWDCWVKETRSERDTCTPMFIPALFIIARTWKQPRCPSADEWIRKPWYIYTMEYYSAIKKKSFESTLMRWMKLEPIIQSEVSQKDKDHYNILTHIYGI